MFRIDHNSAIELEHQVRRLYRCDRFGVFGLVNADIFETNPMAASIMVMSYIHAKGLQVSETQCDEFLCKYSTVFTYPNENDAENEVANYIKDLTEIIESCL